VRIDVQFSGANRRVGRLSPSRAERLARDRLHASAAADAGEVVGIGHRDRRSNAANQHGEHDRDGGRPKAPPSAPA
jgi:hypothetical protein